MDEPVGISAKIAQCLCVKKHTPQPVILDIHHIIPKSRGGPDIISNKVTVCPTGHAMIHAYMRHFDYAGKVVKISRANQYLWGLAAKGWVGSL